MDQSAGALTELRQLVRGIRPPVLADRGLVEAVRALAAFDGELHLSSPVGGPTVAWVFIPDVSDRP